MNNIGRYLLVFTILIAACNEWELEKKDFIQVRLLNAQATGLTSATAEAEALDLSIGQISDHGFIWSAIDEVPTFQINQGQLDLGRKTPDDPPGFSGELTGLKPDTRYFIRAYAALEEEIVYSEVFDVVTSTASVITEEIFYETGRSLQVSGRITGVESGIFALRHGFCWSTENTTPSLEDTFVDFGNQRTGAIFTYTLDSLATKTTYYFRAFAELRVNDQLNTVYGEVLTFDGPLRDVWELVSEVPVDDPGSGMGYAVFTAENKAYVHTYRNLSMLLEFDPQGDQWQEKTPIVPASQRFIQGISIGNRGYIYIPYPLEFVLDPMVPVYVESNVWQYDPSTDSWQARMAMNRNPRISSLAVGLADAAYFGTGEEYEPGCTYTYDWWKFSPDENCDSSIYNLDGCWEEKPQTPNQGLHELVGFSIDQKIYLGTGNICPQGVGAVRYYRDWWAYDPTQDLWEEKAFFVGEEDTALAAFAIGDKGYVFGSDGKFWEYDPAKDSWQPKSSLLISFDSISSRAVGFSLNGVGYLIIYDPFGNTKAQLWKYAP